MGRLLGRFIWDFSEMFGIPLGRLAPIVFGWMIGCKGERKMTKPKQEGKTDDCKTN